MGLYKCQNVKGVDGLYPLEFGDRVESRYRARWKGSIVNVSGNREHATAIILQEFDRRGKPIRKPRKVRLDTAWLRKL